MILFVFGFVSAVDATLIKDVYDANHYYMDPFGSNKTYSWTFDIKDEGFNPETQDVISALVRLNFSDDNGGLFEWSEYALVNIGGNYTIWEVDSGDIDFRVTSLITLNDYGTVDAKIRALAGDFYFETAWLYAEATEGTPTMAHASEPASIAIFGSGLICLALIVRKKFGSV